AILYLKSGVTPTPTPTVSITASPSSISTGASSTLTWSSTNADSCTASGGWTGTKATYGTQSVNPTSTTTYTLTCTGTGGSASQSAMITVQTTTGNVFYISPTGSDSNPGTSASPWKTFAFAIPKLNPGSTLILLDGNYYLASTGRAVIDCSTMKAKSGTALSPITIKSLNERKAIIKHDTGTTNNENIIFFLNCGWWNVDGLSFLGNLYPDGTRPTQFIAIYNSSNMVVRRNLMKGPVGGGVVTTGGSHDILIEENELYSHDRNGIYALSSNHITFRRNYCRGGPISEGTGGAGGPQDCIISYYSTDNIFENNIAQDTSSGCFHSTGQRDRFLGNIAMNCPNLIGAGKHPGEGMVSKDVFVENTVGIGGGNGATGRSTINFTVKNSAFFGTTNVGVVSDNSRDPRRGPGHCAGSTDGTCTIQQDPGITVQNTLVQDGSGGYYVENANEFAIRVFEYSHGWNNFRYTWGTGTETRNLATTPPPGVSATSDLGTCKVFIPDASSLKGKGKNGADIGANILYRYENGVLTNKPLWDPITGEFPHGAIIPGVNDIAGQSAFDVHKRLNINTNGCAFPAGYGSGTITTPAPTISLSASPSSISTGASSTLTWSSTNADSCTASNGWTGTKATYGTQSVNPTSTMTYTLTCTGTGGSASQSAIVTIPTLTGTITGLDFPGSDGVNTIRFKFTNPQNNGLPIYGPGGQGVTYIWRAYPRFQPYYFTTFFWGNDDGQGNLDSTWFWDNGSPGTYYGAHPYPIWPDYTFHKWEIASDGYDYTSTENVVYNKWYTQALICYADTGGKHCTYYYNLPDTTKTVVHDSVPSWGNTNPPAPALTFGDAPWNPGKEVYNGILRGFQIYNSKLSLNDVLSEVNSPLSTSAGAASIWYLNINPTPNDISDKSGKGHNPVWVGTKRPALYSSGSIPNPTPTVTVSAIAASSITSSSATITWTTNENADTQVDYGTTTAYGLSTALNTALVTSHLQSLSGLNANTLYHYRVKSRDAAGNLAQSNDFTFTTSAASDATTSSSNLPSWVKNLPLWQWYEIPNTALSSVAPSPTPCGITGPISKIVAWTGATLKRQGSLYVLGAAGGHGDYCGNEVDAIQLNTDNPRWVQLSPPSPNSQVINSAQYYLDLKPSATHTYYATQFINARNRMIVVDSPGMGLGGLPNPPAGWPYAGDPGYSFSFNLYTNSWDAPEYVSRYTGGGDFTAALVAKHPVTEDIYYSRTYGGEFWKWTQATNSWSKINTNSETNYAGAAIDPKRNRMLVVGSYSGTSNPRIRNLVDASSIPVTFNGLGASVLQLSGYPGVVYDEANDKFLVFYNSGSGIKIYRVDAETMYVDTPSVTGTVPTDRQNGIQNSVQYVPELGGIVIANSYDGNVMFMRTSLR
ncbi:right-handed parallel beta-helix repeat-containing protein, partial [Candidatus Woesearchaeota archaeon]|nr:right-handed parallel beta-helix repeat-containing protein [Candidatus Woesearchaeota archaeon]